MWIRTTDNRLVNTDSIVQISFDSATRKGNCSIVYESTSSGREMTLATYSTIEQCSSVIAGLYEVLTSNRIIGVAMPKEDEIDDTLKEWYRQSGH